MPSPRLLLASTSVHRRELLQRLGVTFECIAPDVDESQFRSPDHCPRTLATRLAALKAAAVSVRHPDAVVIGADQVCDAAGSVFSKPGNSAAAEHQLSALAGTTHQLHTAVCVTSGVQSLEFVATARLRMRPLTVEQIRRYVSADRPFDCAGSYRIESLGIALFDEVECDDFTAIIGLPLIRLVTTLRSFGFQIP